jgi:hypothetical protein
VFPLAHTGRGGVGFPMRWLSSLSSHTPNFSQTNKINKEEKKKKNKKRTTKKTKDM